MTHTNYYDRYISHADGDVCDLHLELMAWHEPPHARGASERRCYTCDPLSWAKPGEATLKTWLRDKLRRPGAGCEGHGLIRYQAWRIACVLRRVRVHLRHKLWSCVFRLSGAPTADDFDTDPKYRWFRWMTLG